MRVVFHIKAAASSQSAGYARIHHERSEQVWAVVIVSCDYLAINLTLTLCDLKIAGQEYRCSFRRHERRTRLGACDRAGQ